MSKSLPPLPFLILIDMYGGTGIRFLVLWGWIIGFSLKGVGDLFKGRGIDPAHYEPPVS